MTLDRFQSIDTSETHELEKGLEGRPWALAQDFHFASYNSSQRSDAIGGLVDGMPLICGGKYGGTFFQDCFIIGKSDVKIQMLEERKWANGIGIRYDIKISIIITLQHNFLTFLFSIESVCSLDSWWGRTEHI